MNKKTALVIAVLFTLLASPAAAESPSLLPVQGYLSDAAGVPIDGARDLELVVYDAASGGNVVHTETFVAHPIVDGNFVVYLGDDASVDLALFRDQDNLWLEITVGSEMIEPRLQIATAPYAGYARYCGDSETLAGQSSDSFAPASHAHDWSAIAGVPPDLADGDADTLDALGVTCANGQVARWSGVQWECGPVAFAAIEWPTGFSFLTIEPCPAGFTALESGYVKLSATPSLVPSARTLATPGHFHSPGTLAVQSAGAHTHAFNDRHYIDTGNNSNYATGAGDDVGQLTTSANATANAGDHSHVLGGTIGASGSGLDGDADLLASGELEHVSLRLCIKN
jgi:hypothetical protein